MRYPSQINIAREEVGHNIQHFQQHFWTNLGLLISFDALNFDDLIENVSQKARQAEIFLKMILHIELFFTDEDSLDELKEMLVVVAN